MVYREETSSVTSKVPRGTSGTCSILCLFVKSVVFQMQDGREVANGYKNQSTNGEMFSIRALLEDMMGLPGLPGLCIFGKR